jgi:hypothetical protein
LWAFFFASLRRRIGCPERIKLEVILNRQMSPMRYKLMPRLPDYPGTTKTYPKFLRIDAIPPTEHQKLHALLKLTTEELGLLNDLAQTLGDKAVFRRLQVRQMSSVLDSFFGTLDFHSLGKVAVGDISISKKERQLIEGRAGIFAFYKTSIKLYARAMGVSSPLGGDLQIAGAARFWPALRARIIHPKTLEQYQFTSCDAAIVQETGKWMKAVQDWALQLQLQENEKVKQFINDSLDELRQHILSQTKRSV